MKIKTRRLLSNFFAVLLSTTILLLSLENIRADEDISGVPSVEIRDAPKGINYLFERPASLWGHLRFTNLGRF